jgi:capsular polysaccharide biosynthesis protein
LINFLDWELIVYRPELFSLVDMYKLVFRAEILFGVHGAAMTHMMLMPPEAHVIETWMDDRSPVNRHFGNMAHWLGLNYSTTHPNYFHANNQVSPESVWNAIEKAIKMNG